MAEEEDKKDEEKLELDSTGQALAYIALDQARVLATRHARENTDFYGRYADRELAWQELSAEESEDYYRIQLSYRPARGFRGRPGVEQFTIDKAGPIELREILSQPQPSRRAAYVLGFVVVLAAIGATIGGLFVSGALTTSDSPTPMTTSISITPDAPARLVSSDGAVTVDVGARTVDAPAQLTYRPLSTAEIPVLPEQYAGTDKAFDLTTDEALLKSITITVRVSAADALLAGGDEANIVIQHHRDGAWTPLDTTVDFGVSTATAEVERLSIFALTIREPEPTPTPVAFPTATLPSTDTPSPSPTPTPIPPTSTPLPTLVPTATLVIAPTPTPASAAVPVPTPSPTFPPGFAPRRTPTPTPESGPATGDAPLPFMLYLGMGVDPLSIFSRDKLREALVLTVDANQVLDAATARLAGQRIDQVASIVVPNLGNPALEQITDPIKGRLQAVQNLGQSGYPNGFSTDLITTPGLTWAAEVVASQLAQIGIEANILVMEGQAFQARLSPNPPKG